MKEFTAIDSDKGVFDFLKYLDAKNIEVLAIDFEGESNLHEYGEKLCLIQIFDGTKYYAIDPFRIGKEAIAGLFENKKILKLFYGADSDLSLVYKQYEVKVKSVLDLKILVDTLNFEKRGLDSVLSNVLNKTISDKEKYQMYNWTLRPIRPEALEYALTDVEYLFELRDELMRRIIGGNKYLDLVYGIVKNRNEFDSKSIPTIFKSNEYKNLRSKEKADLKSIYDVRDGYAKSLNLPPNVVLEKKYLFMLAKGEIEVSNIAFTKRISERTICEITKSLTELLSG